MSAAGFCEYPVERWRHSWFDGIDLSRNELIHSLVDREIPLELPAPSAMVRFYPRHERYVAELSELLDLTANGFSVAPGSDAALRAVCLYYAQISEGLGTVLCQYPNYPAVEQTAIKLGLRVHQVSIDPERWGDQVADLMTAAVTHSNAMIYVSVPNGPLGGALTESQIDLLAAVSVERKHLLVVDSCYQAFNGDLIAHLRRPRENTVVVQSLSKSHGLAGARVAIVSCLPALLNRIDLGHLEHAVSNVSLAMAVQRVRHTAFFEKVWAEISTERSYARAAMRKAGLTPVWSGGNFLSVATPSPVNAEKIAEEMLSAGYRVKVLGEFPGLGKYFRFTIAEQQVNHDFIAQLDAAVSLLRSDGRWIDEHDSMPSGGRLRALGSQGEPHSDRS